MHTSPCSYFVPFIPKAKIEQSHLHKCLSHADQNPESNDRGVVPRGRKAGAAHPEEDNCKTKLAWRADYPHSEVCWQHKDHISYNCSDLLEPTENSRI